MTRILTSNPIPHDSDEWSALEGAITRRMESVGLSSVVPIRANRLPSGDVAVSLVATLRREDLLAEIAAARAEACMTSDYNPDTIVIDPEAKS